MKAVVLALLLLVAVAAAAVERTEADWETLFAQWVAKHKKAYSRESMPAQYQKRFEIFKENQRFIDAHNAKEGETWTMEMNKFGDLTAAEFEAIMGLKPRSALTYKAPKYARPFVSTLLEDPPKELDWRAKDGIVNKVKNQGGCGSCWAFSAVGAIESAWALKHKNLTRLSEQNIVDCSDRDMGCSGGFQHHGIEYAMEMGGINTEECYPYTGRDGSCKFKKDCIGATVHSYGNITGADEVAMVKAMFENGPLASAVYVKSSDWRFYKKGVYSTTGCPTGYFQLNHAIILVGYGNESGKDFWVIRNSWGADWGNAGHMNIARNAKNMCGIATDPQWVKSG